MTKLVEIAREEIVLHLRQAAFYVSLGLTLLLFVAASALPRLQQAAENSPLSAPLAALQEESIFADDDTLRVPTGYVDHAGIIQFVPSEQGRYFLRFETEAAAAEHVRQGLIESYYVIPADFVTTGEVSQFSQDPQLIAPTDKAVEAILRENLLRPLEQRGLSERLRNPVNLAWRGTPPPTFAFVPADLDAAVLRTASIVAGVFAYLLNVGGFLLLGALQRERNSRVLELLLTSTTPRQLIGGKLLGLSVLAFVQVAVALLAGFVVATTGEGGSAAVGAALLPAAFIIVGIPYLLLGYAVYGSVIVGAVALLPNLGESMQLQFLLRLLFLTPLVGVLFILPNPHSPTAVALSLLPVSSPLLLPFRVLLVDVPTWQVGVSLILLVGWAALLFELSTRLFRAQSLLMGRRPTLRALAAALWQAA